jgi:hypothetical protein
MGEHTSSALAARQVYATSGEVRPYAAGSAAKRSEDNPTIDISAALTAGAKATVGIVETLF